MDLVTVSKVGEKQGTTYSFGCTSNGTWGRLHCGISKRTVDIKEKTDEEKAHDADIAKRMKEDPWAVYATDMKSGVTTKYNLDAEVSGTAAGWQGTYSARDGYSGGPVLNLPKPADGSAVVQVCIKKDGPKSKESGTTYEAHADHPHRRRHPCRG